MSLSQLTITNAKPKAKPYMLTDGDGLHVRIDPSGSKLWRLRYRFEGKANMVSLGSFPSVSLLFSSSTTLRHRGAKSSMTLK
jgi:Arm DNA-binding domain